MLILKRAWQALDRVRMLEQELAATDWAGGPSKSDRREAATCVQHHVSAPAEVYSCDKGVGAGQAQEVAGERCVCVFGRRAAWRAWERRARFQYAHPYFMFVLA